MLLSLVKLLVAVAVGVPLLMWFFQERLIFFPRPLASRPATSANVEEITVAAADGAKLRGWLVRSGSARAPLVIYFGGNAEEVSWMTQVADKFAGWSLLLVNYRGYGESEGKPGEKELRADALATYDYARGHSGVNPDRIVAMGRSLGSGVAVQLAAERPVRGVILVSPYDSLVEVGRRHYPFLPISLMLRHRFDSLARAPQIKAPLLCLVAGDDRIVPVEHSRALFAAWRGPKTWRELPRADHDGIAGESEYWSSIELFLKSSL
jgi:pimeloyl-ACP methyl ester carboxylesterase